MWPAGRALSRPGLERISDDYRNTSKIDQHIKSCKSKTKKIISLLLTRYSLKHSVMIIRFRREIESHHKNASVISWIRNESLQHILN